MLVAVVAAFGAATVQRRLRPDWATWTLTALAGGSALAVVWAVSVLAMSFALEHPTLASIFGWCRAVFSTHDRVSMPVGVAAWIVLALMTGSGARHLWRRRRASAAPTSDVIQSDVPLAFAVPGRVGQLGRIVVSTGMLAALDEDERRVLYAHERSHLHRHHHRFLHVAEAAAAAVPFLRPLSRQVRFATERWADEDAAAEVGDRHIVARAIARAALAASGVEHRSPALSFTGCSTRARVAAMLKPSLRTPWTSMSLILLGVSTLAVSIAGSGIQLHHLVEFVGHICRV
jgi:Zn-dependent protease with chaperone function